MSISNSLSPDDFERLLKESLQSRVPKTPPPRRIWYRIRSALRTPSTPINLSTSQVPNPCYAVSALSYATVNSYIWRNLI